MKKAWAIGGLVCLIAGHAMAQAGEPAPPENRYSAVQAQRQAEREHIHQERQAIAATRKREETACYRRFAVEDCLRDVRTQARRAELQLRGRELQLNDAERKEKRAGGPIVTVIGPKGGLGKTLAARMIIDRYRANGQPVRA